MRTNAELAGDLATLARLHAALDAVVETEDVIAAIHDTSASPPPGISRVGALLGEARELLRSLLVGKAPRPSSPGAPMQRPLASARSGQR